MPLHLKESITKNIYMQTLSKINCINKNFPKETLEKLTLHMNETYYGSGEVI